MHLGFLFLSLTVSFSVLVQGTPCPGCARLGPALGLHTGCRDGADPGSRVLSPARTKRNNSADLPAKRRPWLRWVRGYVPYGAGGTGAGTVAQGGTEVLAALAPSAFPEHPALALRRSLLPSPLPDDIRGRSVISARFLIILISFW